LTSYKLAAGVNVDNSGNRPAGRPRILCIDDDQLLLGGLRRQLSRQFEVVTAASGEQGLLVLQEHGDFAVIVSDMRMPGMSGVEVLSRARTLCPDTTRVLLTGYTDIDSAAAAINRGNIFRLLLKPSKEDELVGALNASVEQYRLVTAEREFFERTLRGAVKALCDTLSLANPAAFARATRVSQVLGELLGVIEVPNPWAVEVAGALSQIGAVVLPPQVVGKINDGLALNADEQELVDDLPQIADRVLEDIPRLEPVRAVIKMAAADYGDPLTGTGGLGRHIPVGARLLRVALDLDTLEAGGLSRSNAVAILRSRKNSYDPEVIAALSHLHEGEGTEPALLAVVPEGLRPGMVIARDVFDEAGRLLVGRGYVVTNNLIERIANWRHTSGVAEPIYINLPRAADA
jgi:response regulator RpfG family c-di-GMP phosphodiesterase